MWKVSRAVCKSTQLSILVKTCCSFVKNARNPQRIPALFASIHSVFPQNIRHLFSYKQALAALKKEVVFCICIWVSLKSFPCVM